MDMTTMHIDYEEHCSLDAAKRNPGFRARFFTEFHDILSELLAGGHPN
jgi:hypothetical protein